MNGMIVVLVAAAQVSPPAAARTGAGTEFQNDRIDGDHLKMFDTLGFDTVRTGAEPPPGSHAVDVVVHWPDATLAAASTSASRI